MNTQTKKIIVYFLFLTFFCNVFSITPLKVNSIEPYFTLIIIKTQWSSPVIEDYYNLIEQQLKDIGIGIEIQFFGIPDAEYCPWWKDADILYAARTGSGWIRDPAFTVEMYSENGTWNIFGYDENMDWDSTLTLNGRTGWGTNEWYMKKGTLMLPPDSQERIQHYWEWEQHLMDNILPSQPLFTQKQDFFSWSNLLGYNLTDGLLQSWGKMSWQGAHDGQLSTTEVVIADKLWSDLNPLFYDDSASTFINSAILDPLIWFDANCRVWPHLAKSYTMINDTLVRIVTRDGIYWAEDPDDMSNHEPFTIKDVYFTLYAWKKVSHDVHLFDWIKEMEIVDDKTLDIFIDGDITTPKKEPYTPFLHALSVNILPEFYLNQTQLPDGKTPDITHDSWNTFSSNAFGTGLFELNNFIKGVETILKVKPECWWLNDTITIAPELNWLERFGDFNNRIDQIRIRVIDNPLMQITEFEKGKLDLVDVTNYPIKKATFKIDSSKNMQCKPLPYFYYFMYNLRTTRTVIGSREPCPGNLSISKGLAVRKAISYALNREEINNVVHGGDLMITDYPIYQSMGIWCNPNIIRYNHNLEKAKEYMALAGYGTIEPTFTNLSFQFAKSIFAILVISIVLLQLNKSKKGKECKI